MLYRVIRMVFKTAGGVFVVKDFVAVVERLTPAEHELLKDIVTTDQIGNAVAEKEDVGYLGTQVGPLED